MHKPSWYSAPTSDAILHHSTVHPVPTQCRIYIYISHVHWAYDYLGPFGVLWIHMAWHKNVLRTRKNPGIVPVCSAAGSIIDPQRIILLLRRPSLQLCIYMRSEWAGSSWLMAPASRYVFNLAGFRQAAPHQLFRPTIDQQDISEVATFCFSNIRIRWNIRESGSEATAARSILILIISCSSSSWCRGSWIRGQSTDQRHTETWWRHGDCRWTDASLRAVIIEFSNRDSAEFGVGAYPQSCRTRSSAPPAVLPHRSPAPPTVPPPSVVMPASPFHPMFLSSFLFMFYLCFIYVFPPWSADEMRSRRCISNFARWNQKPSSYEFRKILLSIENNFHFHAHKPSQYVCHKCRLNIIFCSYSYIRKNRRTHTNIYKITSQVLTYNISSSDFLFPAMLLYYIRLVKNLITNKK